MQKLITLSSAEDPMPLSRHLWAAGIGHRILPGEQGHDVWLLDVRQWTRAQEVLSAWHHGAPMPKRAPNSLLKVSALVQLWRRLPVTISLIVVSLLVSAGMSYWPGEVLFAQLAFTPLQFSGQYVTISGLETMLASGQWWRFITPIFMHFGLMHLIFNLMWVWVLGGRLEAIQGSRRTLLIIVLAGVLSNLAQFWFNPTVPFGGASGVIYAYLGYMWLWDRRHPEQPLNVPTALVIFMVGWMVFCMTDLAGSLGFHVANEAHLGGLLVGLLLALLPCKTYRR
ncbi:hypothetical protein BFW38_03560 [Terasakiispira papahanaumokuakeensis]|uniref:Peptidase S54 rhomboid domain-containing protein n=1 Tax=Terasakiispira papahanaumokuakeensis TaxID=197479 RepID=A0A1E2VDR7_9GAMM|nr:rhomboid family intramembrane serine protease [Terasakiispira papahanaumokuakeensis]ODC05158.1 hypothetical protein BFW38_03560 [Terasakiispira papahanaumokuakeensis]